ncbi:hypothetical protein, partial [Escherichia coli]|uniref:hypothetical protein n=1 Tax=Escherichia coli TaxID=562 RepID=UPI0028D93D34
CYGIKIDHTERETTGVVGKAERLTWHKAWTMVSTGFSISYTSSLPPSSLFIILALVIIAAWVLMLKGIRAKPWGQPALC